MRYELELMAHFQRLARAELLSQAIITVEANVVCEIAAVPEYARRVRRIQVLAGQDSVVGDDSTHGALRCLLYQAQPVLTGFSFVHSALNPVTLAVLGTCTNITELAVSLPTWRPVQNFGVFLRLTILRVTVPFWGDLVSLNSLPCLTVLDINTTETSLLSCAPMLVTFDAITTLVWRHSKKERFVTILTYIATGLILPELEEFHVERHAEDMDSPFRNVGLEAAAATLSDAFTTSSRGLHTYGLSCMSWHDIRVFANLAPSTVSHLRINMDGFIECPPSRYISETIEEITLVTTLSGAHSFLAELSSDARDVPFNIRRIIIDAVHAIKNGGKHGHSGLYSPHTSPVGIFSLSCTEQHKLMHELMPWPSYLDDVEPTDWFQLLYALSLRMDELGILVVDFEGGAMNPQYIEEKYT
jgi:hypothetical protein